MIKSLGFRTACLLRRTRPSWQGLGFREKSRPAGGCRLPALQKHAKAHLFREYVFSLQPRSRNNFHLEYRSTAVAQVRQGKSAPALYTQISSILSQPGKAKRLTGDGSEECSAWKVAFSWMLGNLPEAKRPGEGLGQLTDLRKHSAVSGQWTNIITVPKKSRHEENSCSKHSHFQGQQ